MKSRISRIVVVLPAPFGPSKPEDFALCDFQRKVLNTNDVAVMLGQVFQLDRCISIALHHVANPEVCGLRLSAYFEHAFESDQGVAFRLGVHLYDVDSDTRHDAFEHPEDVRRMDAVHGGAWADDRVEAEDALVRVFVRADD